MWAAHAYALVAAATAPVSTSSPAFETALLGVIGTITAAVIAGVMSRRKDAPIDDHSTRIRDIEQWRANRVDPTLTRLEMVVDSRPDGGGHNHNGDE